MAHYYSDFTDPLDDYEDNTVDTTPEPYLSTPEMRENLKRNLIEEGHLEVIAHFH